MTDGSLEALAGGAQTLGTDLRREGTERRAGGGSERKNRKMGKVERRITGEGRGETMGRGDGE